MMDVLQWLNRAETWLLLGGTVFLTLGLAFWRLIAFLPLDLVIFVVEVYRRLRLDVTVRRSLGKRAAPPVATLRQIVRSSFTNQFRGYLDQFRGGVVFPVPIEVRDVAAISGIGLLTFTIVGGLNNLLGLCSRSVALAVSVVVWVGFSAWYTFIQVRDWSTG